MACVGYCVPGSTLHSVVYVLLGGVQSVYRASQPYIIHSTKSSNSNYTMSFNTSTLPQEVVATICALLPRSDLKVVRLVSHAWDEAAQRLLFQTVFLKVNLRSFEKLH